MITLCVDPGLRNLSLCIMNSEYEILLWDTFNILDGDDYHCESYFKNGKICGRKCTMKYQNQNKENVYTCKTHFPKEIKKTKINDFKKKSIDDYLLQDIALTFINRLQEIYDQNPVLKTITNILIELQPKCNPKSLFVSHIMYGKFIELYKNTIPIRFVRASQKLKAYIGPPIECKLKGKYAQRKWLSIKYGEWFLENKFSKEQRDKWLPTLTGKLDDRFDCLLMCINAITGIPKKQITNKKGKCIK
jgi:hypothetical protein